MNPNNITQFPKSAIERLAFPIDRKSIEATIQMLVDLLDTLDPDADDEPTEDAEPSLGWPLGHGLPQLRRDMAHDDDREQDDADAEEGGDDEPSLGSPECRFSVPLLMMAGDPPSWLGGQKRGQVMQVPDGDQSQWSAGDCTDLEQCVLDGPHDDKDEDGV